MANDTTIIIPTFNRCDLLFKCLDSLASQTYTDYAAIVVDDGSSEDVSTFVEKNFDGVDVVRLSKNSGFAVAANTGLRKAATPYVMLLNNDMTLAPDCVERLVRALEDGTADMVAPLVLWDHDRDQIYSAGDRICRSGRPEAIGFREARNEFLFDEKPFGVSGGAALMKRAILGEVGYLDERFVAYFEDADLCFRARLAGFSAAVAPKAEAYHVGSASISDRLWWRSRQCFRNHTLLVAKNMPARVLAVNAQEIGRERIHQFRSFVTAARAEHGLLRTLQLVALVAVDLLALVPHAWRERRRIQRSRKISDDELNAILASGEPNDGE